MEHISQSTADETPEIPAFPIAMPGVTHPIEEFVTIGGAIYSPEQVAWHEQYGTGIPGEGVELATGTMAYEAQPVQPLYSADLTPEEFTEVAEQIVQLTTPTYTGPMEQPASQYPTAITPVISSQPEYPVEQSNSFAYIIMGLLAL